MQDARTRAALLAICLACLLGSGYVLLKGRQAEPPPIVFSSPPASVPSANSPAPATSRSASKPLSRVYVDVAGAVRRPALYLLPRNSRVMQAVLAAGGPTEAADLDAVNLAQPVTDGEKVYIPKHGVAFPAPGILAASSASVMPRASVQAGKGKGESKESAKAGHSSKLSPESGEQIGLNSATAEQLERLPSVGPSMAARILAYRQQAGGFSKIEDLMMITGIGPKKFAKIAPCVSLN